MKIFNIIVLALSCLALFYACTMRLIHPDTAVFLQSYFEHLANSLETHIDLANEIRGVGMVMLLGGIVALIGAIWQDFRQAAFMVATVIFAGVILGRLVSFAIDGLPHTGVLRAAVAEAVLAGLNVVCLANSMLKGNVPSEDLGES